MAHNINHAKIPVKPIDICCSRCKRPQPRRFGLVVPLRIRVAFVCSACCAALYGDGYGPREEIAYLMKNSRENIA
jgi:hypothetical protein